MTLNLIAPNATPGRIFTGLTGTVYTADASGNIAGVLAADVAAFLAAGCTSGSGSSSSASVGTEGVTTIASSGASQTLAFPASGSAAYDITLTGNCAITLTGGTVGQYQHVILILRQGSSGGYLPTLSSGVRWPGGAAPAPNTTAGKIDVFTFSTSDGGATIFGSY